MMTIRVAVNEKGARIGEDHHNARYSDHEVEMVMRLHDEGMGYRKIVAIMEMPKSTVRDIIKGNRRCQFAVAYKTVKVAPPGLARSDDQEAG